jgi:ATP-binding cassette subfamily F protein uup
LSNREGEPAVKAPYGEKSLIIDFSVKIIRGDRIGTIGPNGVGKSTLLRILLDEMVPNQGKIRTGIRLER